MIIQVIEAIATSLGLSFQHGKADFQNLIADEGTFPALYLDQPITTNYELSESNYTTASYPVKLLFLYKSEIDWTPEEHDTNCITPAESLIRAFVNTCNNSVSIDSISSLSSFEFINLLDCNLSGKSLDITIKLVNDYSVCATGINDLTKATVVNSDDSYTSEVGLGNTLTLPDITITDSDGTIITYPSVQDFVCTPGGSFVDPTYSITDSDETVLYSGTLSSGGALNQEITDNQVNINNGSFTTILAQQTLDLIVNDTDGNLVGSDNVGEWTIQDSSITNSDASYSNTVLAEDSLILPDITITKADATTISFPSVKNVDVRDYQSGIAYQRPQLTGQTTSYRTGDDAWRVANMPYAAAPANPTHIATLVDFFTLAANNALGNTLRFTDQSGAAAVDAGGLIISSDTLIDHYTGLEHAVNNAQTGNNKNWNTAIDECLALNVQGFDDWYLPNASEELSVAYYKGKSDSLTLIAGIGARSFWTSTTQFDDTLRALRYNNTTSANIILQGNTKTSNMNYIPVRQRY
jgi:hypothetical protein